MYMIMLVLDDMNYLDAVLNAWERVGIRGATIIESTGIQRLKRKNVPMRFLFQSAGLVEEGHYTLFVIVESDQMAHACLQATEGIVGNLDDPNTGVFAAWPLPIVKGVPATTGGASDGLD
jgi:hypothetical protein